jgi:glycerol-3-phosphate dehydrogenase (NAD(P)+)
MNTAVVGSGAWGTALALQLYKNGHNTLLWTHDAQRAKQMMQSGSNARLEGICLPRDLKITADTAALQDRKLVVIATPSVHFRGICKSIAPYLHPEAVLVSVTKGIESGTLMRMSEIAREEAGHPVVVLTGPNHAEEVARSIPTATLAACENKELAEMVQTALTSDTFRVYTSPDVIGAELGGAMKNVIALCAGVCDGLGYGDNTKAMLMTRGLTEIARLGVAMGASRDTFAGLAGMGDLIVTCTSMHSRNRRAGILIGQGKSVSEAMEQVGAVVEGYYAAKSSYEIARKHGVEMPIINAAYSALYEGMDAKQAVHSLLLRQIRPEQEDAGWN